MSINKYGKTLRIFGAGHKPMKWWKRIMDALEKSRTVTILDLRGNKLSRDKFLLVVNMLLINKTIRSLNLANNRLDSKDIGLLAANLNTFILEHLDLTLNFFDREGA